MTAEPMVMGVFHSEDEAVAAVKDLRESPFELRRVNSPIPSHKLEKALRLKKSPVGWVTLAGGIIGFFTGFLLAVFTANRWELIVSGKPVIALIPFLIVGFEFTVLFGVFGNIIGFLAFTRLPKYRDLEVYDERLSGEHFGVLATCGSERVSQLEAFFRERGADTRIFQAA
jgi:molybdopterin-containing oxidoreductase family membrane subunit